MSQTHTRNFAGAGLVAVIALVLAVSCALASGQDPAPYVLGPEDVVVLTVARHPEFSGELLVPSDGVVNIPSLGPTKVSGKTLSELAAHVSESLRSRLRAPEVTATLKMARMQRVYVLGSVVRPGLYDLKPGWRITEALAAAGGLETGTEPADCTAVVLRAADRSRVSAKLIAALRGTQEANLALASGDVLTIDTVGTLPVYVMGRVRNPGLYKIRADGARIPEALTLAGGSLDDAALSRVAVTHLDGKTETVNLTTTVAQGKREPGTDLKPGDLVLVPETTTRIAVLGYVNQPGFLPVRDGQTMTLTDALGQAHGVDKQGDMGQVAIVRVQDGRQTRLSFDLRKFLKSGDERQNPEVKPGDVVYIPKSGGTDWETVLRTIASVSIIANPFVP